MDTFYRLPALVSIVGGAVLYLLRRYGLAAFAIVALLAIPLAAEAGSNIRQKDTGATVWQDQDGIESPVGESGLVIIINDVSTAQTAYVITHRAGNVVKIYSVINEFASFGSPREGVTTADTVIDFGYVVGESAGTQLSISSTNLTDVDVQGGVITITGHTTSDGSQAGDLDSVVFTVGTDPQISVSQGQVIWAHTDGGSTNAVSAHITIIIE